MNIHVWAPSFSELGGGIGASSRELAHNLRMLGHSVTQISPATTRPSLFQKAIFTTKCLAKSVAAKPDIIICTHLHYGPLALLARGIANIPYAILAHGIDVHDGLSPMRKKALRKSNVVLPVSRWTQQRVFQALGEKVKSTILPNTYNADKFTPAAPDPSVLVKFDIPTQCQIILMVARLDSQERYKGHDIMLHLVKDLQQRPNPVKLVIAGTGDDLERLKSLATKLGVASHVAFLGFVTHTELVSLLRRADVFALPSTGEGFGIVYLEAMACGTPVLAGNRDGGVDALAGGKLGLLIDPTDPVQLQNGINDLLDQQGPSMWFDKQQLSSAVSAEFGYATYQRKLSAMLSTHFNKEKPCAASAAS